MVVSDLLVSLLVRVTVALGTSAPLVSFTVPWMLALNCAFAEAASKNRNVPQKITRSKLPMISNLRTRNVFASPNSPELILREKCDVVNEERGRDKRHLESDELVVLFALLSQRRIIRGTG